MPPKNSACNTSTVAFCESPFEFGPVNQAQWLGRDPAETSRLSSCFWVAAKELKLSYYNSKTMFFGISIPYCGNLN